MSRALRSFLFALLAFVAGTWLLCSPRREAPADVRAEAVAPSPSRADGGASGRPASPALVPRADPSTEARPAPTGNGRGFRTPARLAEHFEKHGAEFDAPTAQAYLVMAQALRDAPVGGDVLEVVRPTDGVVNRFDRRSGAFLAYDPDGTIRTFFKPNDGEDYFRRQLRRLPR